MNVRAARPARVLAAAACSVALVVPLSAPAEAAPWSSTKASKAYGKAAEKATNKHRVAKGLKKLKGDSCLAKWAAKHAKRLAREGSGIWHQDINKVLRDCDLSMVGENVAAGYPSGKAVVNQGWMNSPGHRANILTARYTRSEVVARRSADGTWYAVQLFGRR